MNKRPISVTIVGLLFILVGAGGLIKGLWSFVPGRGGGITGHELLDATLVAVSGLAALVSGVFMLRGANWARWLCIFWMAFHVAISIGHQRLQLIVHSVWLLVLLILLLRPQASAYFQNKR